MNSTLSTQTQLLTMVRNAIRNYAGILPDDIQITTSFSEDAKDHDISESPGIQDHVKIFVGRSNRKESAERFVSFTAWKERLSSEVQFKVKFHAQGGKRSLSEDLFSKEFNLEELFIVGGPVEKASEYVVSSNIHAGTFFAEFS